MYKIPTEADIDNMQRNFPLVVREEHVPINKFKSYSIVRKALRSAATSFFEFEGRKDNNVISIYHLKYGKDGLTGTDTWDELNRISAIKAIIEWAKAHNASDLIVHTADKPLFEVLWDEGFGHFKLAGRKSSIFAACGKITF
jgi:hypothetical protein